MPDIIFNKALPGLLRRARARHLSLNSRLVLNLSLIGGTVAFLALLLISISISRSFAQLEDLDASHQIARTEAYLADAREETLFRSRDWGIWDESFNYIKNYNSQFENSNINPEAFRNAKVQGIAYVRFDGSGNRSFYFDDINGNPRPDLAAALLRHVSAPAFRDHVKSRGDFSYFVDFDKDLFVIAGCKVLPSSLRGPSPGYIVFLQRFDGAALNKAIQADASIELGVKDSHSHFTRLHDLIKVSVPLRSQTGATIASVSFNLPRNLNAVGKQMQVVAFMTLLTLGTAMMLLLRWRIAQLIIQPINRLSEHVRRTRETGQLVALPTGSISPEIDALHDEFNAMFQELEDLRIDAEAHSFAIGKNQSYAGVMHNLRNSLNPIKVILNTLTERLDRTLPPETARALDELAKPDTPAERREKLAAFMTMAQEETKSSLEEYKNFAEQASVNLGLSLDVINGVHFSEKSNLHNEQVNLTTLLKHATNAARFNDATQVDLIFDCPDGLLAVGNRVLLSQVFENLITNAVDSIKSCGKGNGSVSIRARVNDDGETCSIIFLDDGEGFDGKISEKLFERGFSTRLDKDGGLGLHWCANTINAMGGRLELTSAGPGKGATATVTLKARGQNTLLPARAA